jgi:ribonuclease T
LQPIQSLICYGSLVTSPNSIAQRFRGFLPVVVDVETGGFNSKTDALLEIAAVLLEAHADGTMARAQTVRYHVKPFEGANMEAASLAVNGIDPFHPLRPAIDERDALQRVFREVRRAVRDASCSRAILVGHNASFDLAFLNEAIVRNDMKRNPFHPFSSFDTATLCGVAFGQTVLARAVQAAGLTWDESSAHSAAYDAEITADVFCDIVNRFRPTYEAACRQAAVAHGDDAEADIADEEIDLDAAEAAARRSGHLA